MEAINRIVTADELRDALERPIPADEREAVQDLVRRMPAGSRGRMFDRPHPVRPAVLMATWRSSRGSRAR